MLFLILIFLTTLTSTKGRSITTNVTDTTFVNIKEYDINPVINKFMVAANKRPHDNPSTDWLTTTNTFANHSNGVNY